MSNQGQTPQSQSQQPQAPMTAAQQQLYSNYREHARALWELNAERYKFSSQIQADYGKWLIVTVATIHSAGVYAVSQSSMPEAVRVNPWSYWPFVIGIVLIMIAGLVTWFNWSLLAGIYGDWLDPKLLTDPNYWPKNAATWKNRALWWTFWGGIAIGIASAGCVPWGTYEALHSPPVRHAQPFLPALKSIAPAPLPKRAELQANPVVNPGVKPEKPK